MTEKQNARDMLDRAERAATDGDFASAEELLRGAARIQEEELGPLHPDLANTLNNLAIVAEQTGRSSEAERLYRQAAAIAAAAFPSDHPMVVASRQNLEDFCRANGLAIDAPAAIAPTPVTVREAAKAAHAPSAAPRPIPDVAATIATPPLPPAPIPARASLSLGWVATGTVGLVVAALLVLRPWSSRDASAPAPTPEPAAAQPSEVTPPRIAAPITTPVPIERVESPAAAPPRDDRNVATNPPAAGGITMATAQLCRTFSTSGSNWRCEPVGESVAPGPLTFYTRVRSPRNVAVVHRWYQGATLRQSVTLKIQANANEGYRTYSRLTVGDGDWRLEVRSADGNSLLHEQRFAVR